MLKTRIITAAILLAIFGVFFYLSGIAWIIFVTLIAALGLWEWGALMRLKQQTYWPLFTLFILLSLLASLFYGREPSIAQSHNPAAIDIVNTLGMAGFFLSVALFALVTVFWLLLVPLWLKYRWSMSRHHLLGTLTGLMVIFPTWLALILLRQHGFWTLLSILCIPWIADTAAYFTGRAFGRHKLAPHISPGKTWEGAFGGLIAVLIYGLWAFSGLAIGQRVLTLIVLTAVSIIGDLFESLLKRQAELKDSSNFLPGHGGILDRIDSLSSTLPVACLLFIFLPTLIGTLW